MENLVYQFAGRVSFVIQWIDRALYNVSTFHLVTTLLGECSWSVTCGGTSIFLAFRTFRGLRTLSCIRKAFHTSKDYHLLMNASSSRRIIIFFLSQSYYISCKHQTSHTSPVVGSSRQSLSKTDHDWSSGESQQTCKIMVGFLSAVVCDARVDPTLSRNVLSIHERKRCLLVDWTTIVQYRENRELTIHQVYLEYWVWRITNVTNLHKEPLNN